MLQRNTFAKSLLETIQVWSWKAALFSLPLLLLVCPFYYVLFIYSGYRTQKRFLIQLVCIHSQRFYRLLYVHSIASTCFPANQQRLKQTLKSFSSLLFNMISTLKTYHTRRLNRMVVGTLLNCRSDFYFYLHKLCRL